MTTALTTSPDRIKIGKSLLNFILIQNEPWFIAKQMAEALGYSQTKSLLKLIPPEHRIKSEIRTKYNYRKKKGHALPKGKGSSSQTTREMWLISGIGMEVAFQTSSTLVAKMARMIDPNMFAKKLGIIRVSGGLTYKTQRPRWLQARIEAAQTRSESMDWLKEFVDYARASGSPNADKYYVNTSRWINKYCQVKDKATASERELHRIEAAEAALMELLRPLMAKGVEYHQAMGQAKEAMKGVMLVDVVD